MPKFIRILKFSICILILVGFLCSMKYLSGMIMFDLLKQLEIPYRSNAIERSEKYSKLIFNNTKKSITLTTASTTITTTTTDSFDYVDDIESQGLTIWISHICDKCGDVILDNSSRTIKKLIPFSVLFITIKIDFDRKCSNYSQLIKLNEPQNYSIGLGHNQILKKVYFQSNKYYKMMIQIIRQDRILPQLKDWLEVLSSMKLKRCALIQSCSHIIDERKPCNVFQPDEVELWIDFLSTMESSTLCDLTNDLFHEDAHWSVPCIQCDIPETCLWEQSIWTTNKLCSLNKLDKIKNHFELKSTKILFIGDSTMRGLYYSLVEHLNGSLNQWSKSHSHLDFTIANLVNVSLGYSYYPRFWEKEEKRPGLSTILQNMLMRFKDMDSENIILIVGGVQWLNSNHLHEINEILAEMKKTVNGLHVIIKEYGAGFHVPASLITYKPKKSRLQLTTQNAQLAETVNNFGFHLLPSYRLTWSRLEEFYPGTCACHFHTVKMIRHSTTNSQVPESYSSISYKIIGSIHKTYFDMLKILIYNITNKLKY